MTEMVPSGLMRGHWRRSDGAAYTGTKLETAETAKVHLHTTAPVLYSTRHPQSRSCDRGAGVDAMGDAAVGSGPQRR